VSGAQRAGISGLLVRTGKFQASGLEGDIEPVKLKYLSKKVSRGRINILFPQAH
jgi:ribonucleotide monophosphatase NagD (HAD superfamily)